MLSDKSAVAVMWHSNSFSFLNSQIITKLDITLGSILSSSVPASSLHGVKGSPLFSSDCNTEHLPFTRIHPKLSWSFPRSFPRSFPSPPHQQAQTWFHGHWDPQLSLGSFQMLVAEDQCWAPYSAVGPTVCTPIPHQHPQDTLPAALVLWSNFCFLNQLMGQATCCLLNEGTEVGWDWGGDLSNCQGVAI